MKLFKLMAVVALPVEALAEAPVIEAVNTAKSSAGYEVSVTIRHPDTGWDHYADGWEVLTPDGDRLGYRELLHPHEIEQPFTRSLGGVAVPDGVSQILIRARCSVDGWNEDTFAVELPD